MSMDQRGCKVKKEFANSMVTRIHVAASVMLSCSLGFLSGCEFSLANRTASLGGSTAGGRGTVGVAFINNTENRAVLTAGTYDQNDRDSVPDIMQFGPGEFDVSLEGESESSITNLTCGRVFAIGSPDLLMLIERNLDDNLIQGALVNGVDFTEPSDDPDEPTTIGSAPAFEALLGVDFPCNSLIIISLENDNLNPGQFRMNFQVVPSESTR